MALDDQLMCSSLWKLFLLFSAICSCYSSLCRLEASWSSPVHSGMSVVTLVQLVFRESCWLLMNRSYQIFWYYQEIQWHNILPDLLHLKPFQLLFSNVPWILSIEVIFLDISFGPGIHNFTFWLVEVFCVGRVFCPTSPFPNCHTET